MGDKKFDLKKGDSVLVKSGTVDPDSGTDIGGWQGRIRTIEEQDEVLVCVEWDSVTLKNMPGPFIEESEEEGLDWKVMNLFAEDVEPTEPRDTEKDVERAGEEVGKGYAWLSLGEEGKRVQEVLAGIDPDDEMALFEAWEEHLEEELTFPFEAEVSEYQTRGPLQSGDKVTVKGIHMVTDLYGVLVKIDRKGKRHTFPLCDLEVTDKKSPNYQLVMDYAVWFANK
ncbi:MAG: calcium-binding protein [Blastocatellia bacterium]|nr:calcium-binding protein [Blastocatellia bacterium]